MVKRLITLNKIFPSRGIIEGGGDIDTEDALVRKLHLLT